MDWLCVLGLNALCHFDEVKIILESLALWPLVGLWLWVSVEMWEAFLNVFISNVRFWYFWVLLQAEVSTCHPGGRKQWACLSVCLVGGRCKTCKSPCHCGNLGIRRLRVSANAFENVLSLLLVNSVGMEKPPEILSESVGSRAFSILEKRAQLYQLIPEASSPFLVLISLLFKKWGNLLGFSFFVFFQGEPSSKYYHCINWH